MSLWSFCSATTAFDFTWWWWRFSNRRLSMIINASASQFPSRDTLSHVWLLNVIEWLSIFLFGNIFAYGDQTFRKAVLIDIILVIQSRVWMTTHSLGWVVILIFETYVSIHASVFLLMNLYVNLICILREDIIATLALVSIVRNLLRSNSDFTIVNSWNGVGLKLSSLFIWVY